MYVAGEDESPIGPMLLEALKRVMDQKLRRKIEGALVKTQGKQNEN